MTVKSLMALFVFLALVGAAATTGMRFMPGAWYETIAKPAWTPPNWLFPPAWTVLYILIAVAGWWVYESAGFGPALAVWLVGLVLNAAWSPLMFGAHRIDLAAIDVVGMWISIVAFIALAWRIDATASLLFVPYLVWVSYAAALNFAILKLNP
jgi:benzodiazapine receptor